MNRRIREGEIEGGAEDQTEEVLEDLNLTKTLPAIDVNVPPPVGLILSQSAAALATPNPVAQPTPEPQPTPVQSNVRAPPPIPPTGLPQGWTQEQWNHFGWQYVEAMKK